MCRFDDPGSLGFEIHALDVNTDPILGNAIIVKVVPGGQAEREKIHPYDAIVSINGEYSAFLSFPAITDRLRTAGRPLTLVLARPWKSAWERIGTDIEGIVKADNLEKFSTGLYSRWQQRDFVLSRTTLAYSEDGILKKKIPLEEIVSVIPTPSDTEFVIIHQGKEVKLKCQNGEDKMMWLHAIECTKRGCFDNVQGLLARISAPLSSGANSAQSTTSVPAAMKKPAPAVPRGPYQLLNKCLLVVKADSKYDDIDSGLPPPVIVPSFPSIDLSLERIILGTQGSS
jgi:hypothetical protein